MVCAKIEGACTGGCGHPPLRRSRSSVHEYENASMAGSGEPALRIARSDVQKNDDASSGASHPQGVCRIRKAAEPPTAALTTPPPTRSTLPTTACRGRPPDVPNPAAADFSSYRQAHHTDYFNIVPTRTVNDRPYGLKRRLLQKIRAQGVKKRSRLRLRFFEKAYFFASVARALMRTMSAAASARVALSSGRMPVSSPLTISCAAAHWRASFA